MRFSVKLSERERKLLSVTGAAVTVLVLGMLLNIPLQTTVNELWEQYRINEENLAQMEEKEAALADVKADHREKRARLERIQRKLLPMMRNSDIDRMLTEEAVGVGLEVLELKIDRSDRPEMVAAYGQAHRGRGEAEEETGIYIVATEMKVSGAVAELEAFVDEIASDVPGIRLTAIHVEQETAGEDAEESVRLNTVLGLELYMCGGMEENTK